MRDAGVDCLPVGSADHLVGMITDIDITCRAVADGRDPASTPVAEVMSPKAPTCFDDQEVGAALDIMEARHVRRLLVLDHDDHMVGVLALGDLSLSTAHAFSEAMVVEAFEEYYHWS